MAGRHLTRKSVVTRRSAIRSDTHHSYKRSAIYPDQSPAADENEENLYVQILSGVESVPESHMDKPVTNKQHISIQVNDTDSDSLEQKSSAIKVKLKPPLSPKPVMTHSSDKHCTHTNTHCTDEGQANRLLFPASDTSLATTPGEGAVHCSDGSGVSLSAADIRAERLRSSILSCSSFGSEQSGRDSGFFSSTSSPTRHTHSTPETRVTSSSWERCNSIEDLPLLEQSVESMDGDEMQRILCDSQGITLLPFTHNHTSINNTASHHFPSTGDDLQSQASAIHTTAAEHHTGPLNAQTLTYTSSTSGKSDLFRMFVSSVVGSIYKNVSGLEATAGSDCTSTTLLMTPIGEEQDGNDCDAIDDNIYENVQPGVAESQTPPSTDRMSMRSVSSETSMTSLCIDEESDDEFDEGSDEFDCSDDDNESDEPQISAEDKQFNVLRELMKTEQSYVSKLALLVTAKTKAEEILKNESTKSLFPYIDSIYKFHVDMLEKFKLRVITWETNRCIADLVTLLAPYLKMYTDYVKNFEAASSLIDKWKAQSKEFSRMLDEVVSGNQGGKLDIKTYMLEPIQRVPRYQLLLQQYMKHIPEADVDELLKVQAAHKIVTEAANHFQFAIKQKGQMTDLIELQKFIDIPILSAMREIKKKGPIQKMNPTNCRVLSRYAFLFNDLLLVCKVWTMRRIAGYMGYTAKHLLPVDGMQVLDSDSSDDGFNIIVKTRSLVLHFHFDTEEEKLEWLRALWEVISEQTRGRLKANNRGVSEITVEEEEMEDRKQVHGLLVGKEAPVFVSDRDVSMCMLCATDFSTLYRRKHHCRGCGSVVCSKCSSRTLKLEYDPSHKAQRVCDECFIVITDNKQVISNKRHVVRERQRNCCLCSGDVKTSTNRGKSWDKYWLEVHEGGMLYYYKARLDLVASSNQAMTRCVLELVNFNNQIVFQLTRDGHVTLIRVEEKEHMLRWLDGFEAAMKDGDAMSFQVDPNQRTFLEATTKQAVVGAANKDDDVIREREADTCDDADADEKDDIVGVLSSDDVMSCGEETGQHSMPAQQRDTGADHMSESAEAAMSRDCKCASTQTLVVTSSDSHRQASQVKKFITMFEKDACIADDSHQLIKPITGAHASMYGAKSRAHRHYTPPTLTLAEEPGEDSNC